MHTRLALTFKRISQKPEHEQFPNMLMKATTAHCKYPLLMLRCTTSQQTPIPPYVFASCRAVQKNYSDMTSLFKPPLSVGIRGLAT